MPVAQTVHPGASRYPRWPSEASLADGYWADFMARFADGVFDPRITHTRASTATYIDRDGYLRTAAINSPRITYDPVTLQCRGYLHEAQTTNLYLNSAVGVTQSITVAATPNTLSFYGTGTITLTGVSTAGPLVGTGANNRVQLTFTPTAGSLTLTVSGSCTLVQLEANPAATSYIPTAGSAVPRAADIAYITGAGFSAFFNATEGTVYCEFDRIAVDGVSGVFSLDDDNNTNRVDYRAGQNFAAVTLAAAGNDIAPLTSVAGINKVAVSYSATKNRGSINGSLVETVGGQGPIPATILNFGSLNSGTFAPPSVIFKSLRVWKRGFSAAETEALTE
jgi:hypothetical protein